MILLTFILQISNEPAKVMYHLHDRTTDSIIIYSFLRYNYLNGSRIYQVSSPQQRANEPNMDGNRL